MTRPHRSGYVALVGRPNVGKSTLLNAFVGVKLAIVTPKPQTTRNRIAGIRTLPGAQVVFLDTPGIHAARSGLNRRMVDTARRALGEADVAALVLDAAAGVTAADRALAADVAASRVAALVVLNKIDRVAKPALLPQMQALGVLLPGRDVVPVSARTGEGIDALLGAVVSLLPAGPRLHAEDDLTTETERFLVQEAVREQLLLALREEVPYGTAVVVDTFREDADRDLLLIQATILVERPGHKGIVIGTGGRQLGEIGRRARLALEAFFGRRIFLELFVRVEPGWSRNPRRLAELGL
ncbi:MAG TPA: GTPase Era [Candidatus Binatia bacterium]|nr:GTPase Era [Candidatus Binatia bacterium]